MLAHYLEKLLTDEQEFIEYVRQIAVTLNGLLNNHDTKLFTSIEQKEALISENEKAKLSSKFYPKEKEGNIKEILPELEKLIAPIMTMSNIIDDREIYFINRISITDKKDIRCLKPIIITLTCYFSSQVYFEIIKNIFLANVNNTELTRFRIEFEQTFGFKMFDFTVPELAGKHKYVIFDSILILILQRGTKLSSVIRDFSDAIAELSGYSLMNFISTEFFKMLQCISEGLKDIAFVAKENFKEYQNSSPNKKTEILVSKNCELSEEFVKLKKQVLVHRRNIIDACDVIRYDYHKAIRSLPAINELKENLERLLIFDNPTLNTTTVKTKQYKSRSGKKFSSFVKSKITSSPKRHSKTTGRFRSSTSPKFGKAHKTSLKKDSTRYRATTSPKSPFPTNPRTKPTHFNSALKNSSNRAITVLGSSNNSKQANSSSETPALTRSSTSCDEASLAQSTVFRSHWSY